MIDDRKFSFFVLTEQLLRYADLVVTNMNTFKRAFSKFISHFVNKISTISVNF